MESKRVFFVAQHTSAPMSRRENWGCYHAESQAELADECHVPGDSIRDLFIPQLEVTNSHLKGSLNHPKKVTKNCHVIFFLGG